MGVELGSGSLLLIVTTALTLVVALTPVVRSAALRVGLLDRPAARKSHTAPIPLLGGAAMYLAMVGTLVVLSDRRFVAEMAAVAVGATWMWLVGLWDDRRGVGAPVKLLAQVGAAAVVIATGVHARLPVPDPVNIALTTLWLVGITNAFNLLDNMDGLAAGISAVAAASFLLLATLSGQYLVGGLAAAILGACAGFVIYNFNPASIFMGDAGSLLIGFLLAVVGLKLRFPTNVPWVTWMVPVLVLGVAVFDTTLVTVSRLRRGVNPLTTPGKDHVSHRFVERGWSRREAVLLLYLAGCVLGGTAIFVSVASLAAAYAVAGVVAVTAVVAIVALERGRATGEEIP